MKKIWKKAASLALAAVLVLTLAIPAAAKQTFDDVPNSWSYKAIEYCAAHKYMNGTGARKFEPAAQVERSMVAKVLHNFDKSISFDLSQNPFTDVPANQWYTNAIVWAYQNGVVSGTSATAFSPSKKVTREQVCAMFYRYYKNYLGKSPELADEAQVAAAYTDYAKVSSYAREPIRWAIQSGFMKGTSATTLSPYGTAKREELAAFIFNFRKILGDESVNSFTPPEYVQPTPPPVTAKAPKTFSKAVAGVTASGVEIDPVGYKVFPAFAGGIVKNTKNASDFVKDFNTVVAVNGAFFNSYSDNNTSGTLIVNGQILQYFKEADGYKPAFIIDSKGKASIQAFKINQSATLYRDGEKLRSTDRIGCNVTVPDNDGTRMVFTRVYRTVAPGKYARAIAVDSSGIITKIYKDTSEVPIPKDGFLLCERFLKQDLSKTSDVIFDECQVGDTIKLTKQYLDAKNNPIPTQDVVSALSCGPTLVKNGQVYCTDATFKQEGFTESKVLYGANAKMAIGVKADGTVVIAHASTTMKNMASVMKGLGYQSAMSLDGGASCCLYVNGSFTIPAGRPMSNMLFFCKK